MLDTRREFMNALAGAGAMVLMRAGSFAAQAKPSRPPGQQPKPGEDQQEETTLDKSQTKALLEANEKGIKKAVEKLFELATDLKAEVEKTDSSKVLSLVLIRKAEEIEKLAKDIKVRAKA